MKKKLMAMLLSMTLLGALGGCGVTTAPNTDSNSGTASSSSGGSTDGKTIGILMPTKSSERWINDGNDMVSKLKELGYNTDLQYAEDVIETQVSQAENLITKGVDCLVIANIDGESLTDVCQKAKDSNIPVIAYDRLIKNTENVDYYISFDNTLVGVQIGEYIEKTLDLKNASGKSYNIELFAGSPDDNNAHMLYDGAMSVLQQYIDKGSLKVVSGQTDFDTVCTLRWDGALAQSRMENILTANYSNGEKVDAVFSSFDGLSRGIVEALRSVGYGSADLPWPVITGQDAETASVKSIIAGEQTQTIFKDTRELAAQAVKTVDAVLKGQEVEVNDTKTYNNGVKVVPSYLCTPISVDINNYKEVLVDSGYIKEQDLK
ncbi:MULTISPECIES: multiple monosaccharide ABC transporter substrate-binding protein [Clostridium]|uniref:Sugar ABC transporter substrate-binding protein n=1 Tax=Clostridium butyricum TaxID=1492 RepID=A0A427SMU0_CLOBU|nr:MULTISPECIES: multiple monosaccharide ABC transporter substrate-binding protein [Clostridium]MDU4853441.1 multiple monosaccharide ABC transporter substrate-binding protein [Clostridioides difficile]ALP91367.1 sugar ABC transporter substrate-binding protein [Clostridium butyricum]ALS17863.1 sugar ABC transporter substrate-binding protein [Clostridium butyricum]ANF14988.1 sugar ABC transporter substrate-binding protein [Clostridium butyricum]AOR94997.1 sugar ABC transporter substrate-binding 